MKTIILLTLVAGAFGQYTLEQQLLLQQQQPLLQPGLPTGLGNPLNVQLQQPFLYPGLQGFGGLGLPNQFYNQYLLNNPYLLKNPYLPITGLPAVETLKEVDILKPLAITGSVELDPLDAVIMENKNKGVGHHEIYSWQRSALPNTGRSSMEFGGYPQQARYNMKPGNRPNWWSNNFNKKRLSPPFTVNNPEHFEITEYA